MTTIETYAILGISLLALAIAIMTGIQARRKHKQIGQALQYIDDKQKLIQIAPPSPPVNTTPEPLKISIDKDSIENIKNLASQLASELNKLN